jgi:hypothetical protein
MILRIKTSVGQLTSNYSLWRRFPFQAFYLFSDTDLPLVGRLRLFDQHIRVPWSTQLCDILTSNYLSVDARRQCPTRPSQWTSVPKDVWCTTIATSPWTLIAPLQPRLEKLPKGGGSSWVVSNPWRPGSLYPVALDTMEFHINGRVLPKPCYGCIYADAYHANRCSPGGDVCDRQVTLQITRRPHAHD